MRISVHVIALGLLLLAAPASADELDGPLRKALREALDVHAPNPTAQPSLLEPWSPAPRREAPRPSDDPAAALAVVNESLRATLERVVDIAAALAQEALWDSGVRAPDAAAGAAESERAAESAVGLSRAAEARGSVIPLPIEPPPREPLPPSPSPPPLLDAGARDRP